MKRKFFYPSRGSISHGNTGEIANLIGCYNFVGCKLRTALKFVPVHLSAGTTWLKREGSSTAVATIYTVLGFVSDSPL